MKEAKTVLEEKLEKTQVELHEAKNETREI